MPSPSLDVEHRSWDTHASIYYVVTTDVAARVFWYLGAVYNHAAKEYRSEPVTEYHRCLDCSAIPKQGFIRATNVESAHS